MPSKYTQFTETHVRDCALDVMRVFNVVDRQRTRPANRQTRNKNSLWSIVSWLNCTSQNSTRMFTKFRMLIDSDITIGHNWAIAYDFCPRVESMFFCLQIIRIIGSSFCFGFSHLSHSHATWDGLDANSHKGSNKINIVQCSADFFCLRSARVRFAVRTLYNDLRPHRHTLARE